MNCAETTITLCADNATSLNAFYVKYQQLSVKLQLFFCNGLLTITASTASVGIDGFFSGINAIKTNTFFFRQMDTHQAKNKAAPPPVNLTVIVIQVCIFFFKL
ncbi:hypothetical protein AB188_00915 (plasmid) [Serratia marcescens]|nr:hypothetical protein AB188_00915 [Serratia marcescens]